MQTHRRSWTLTIDGREREIAVEYAGLSGWMSMFVDGRRVERRWREWQTVWGGATIEHHLDGHHLRARITQPFGRQSYAFALSVDGMIQAGSDDLPSRGSVRRSTVVALGGLALAIAVITIVRTLGG